MDVPEIHYARSGDVAIAYQVVGDGPIDIVFVPTFANLVFPWFNRDWKAFYDGLASFARLILLDKRGTGLSDRPRDLGSLEARMDDIRAVVDAVEAERAVLVASGAGGQPCAMFAATYPERTRALVLVNTPARAVKAEDYPYGLEPDAWREQLREVRQRWGERDYFEEQARRANPSADDEFVSWFVTCQRFNASPGAALNFYRVLGETDLRDVLSSISVPTLVLHGPAQRDEMLDVARRVPDARSVALAADTLIETFESIARETRAFVEDERPEDVPDSVLATVLFTDLVGSTERAATIGDRAWRDLLSRHHEDVRRELVRYRGEEIDSAGDGFFCRFDGPARAVACAQTIVTRAKELDLAVRAGIHTGECEVVGEKLAGISVVTGARVAALADSGEVLVSQTVKDLVAGSGFEFIDRGTHELKGVPGDWRLYSAAART
ncbi:MAG TPA: adenylate/guanylate cyclase domain-containing protein [Gaiellaceae bacterium]|nr:adenylate/guanylate cyclase domain-containing protein [Gaiellaceae bacterium]